MDYETVLIRKDLHTLAGKFDIDVATTIQTAVEKAISHAKQEQINELEEIIKRYRKEIKSTEKLIENTYDDIRFIEGMK